MSFELGDVLTRAIQIAWRNRILWLFSALPSAISFLILPVMIVPMIFFGMDSRGNLLLFENPWFLVLFVAANILISVLAFVLYIVSTCSVTLGVLRAENGEASLSFRGLLGDGMKYFTRILGVGLLFGVGISILFVAIFFGMVLIGVITAGIGFICAQPLILVLYPVMMMAYAFIEEAQAGVVADDMGVLEAIARAWSLIKAHFWRILLITLVVYFGVSILSSIVVLPFMVPFFFFPFFLDASQAETGMRSFGLIMAAFGVILLPVMILVQGITITLMKSAYVLVYLRLTRPRDDNAPITIEANA
jgi:hypothetical protein